jgi:dTDP-4-dehydrorhamnose reductase
MTAVDECERNTQTAVDVNATAPAQMAQHVSDVDARFVHVSTDYVFAGDRRSPYDEGHQPDPIQVYGESKLAGERNVRQNHSEALIVRTSFLYGLRGDNNKLSGFPAWLLSNINDGEPVALFSDQWITPTNTTFAAKSILNLIETGISGLVHLAGSACMTPFEFGEIVADTAGHDTEKLSKATMDEAEREAPRPSYTCLETSKLRRLTEVSPQGPRETLQSFN